MSYYREKKIFLKAEKRLTCNMYSLHKNWSHHLPDNKVHYTQMVNLFIRIIIRNLFLKKTASHTEKWNEIQFFQWSFINSLILNTKTKSSPLLFQFFALTPRPAKQMERTTILRTWKNWFINNNYLVKNKHHGTNLFVSTGHDVGHTEIG